MELSELRDWYLRYQNFWQEWKNYQYNDLNSHEIAQIERFRDNNFHIDTQILIHFYTEEEIINHLTMPLIKKLKATYDEYKEWVTLRFLLSLARYMELSDLYAFSATDFDHFPILRSIQVAVLDFNCKSIEELISTYDERWFIQEQKFDKVLNLAALVESLLTKGHLCDPAAQAKGPAII